MNFMKYIPKRIDQTDIINQKTGKSIIGGLVIFGTSLSGDLSIIDMAISEGAQVMTHPLEDGTTRADHQIILPVEITANIALKSGVYKDLYTMLQDAQKNVDLFMIQTKTATYTDMMIVNYPHIENAKQTNMITVKVAFKELQLADPVKFTAATVANPSNANTVASGAQQGASGSSAGQSMLAKLLG